MSKHIIAALQIGADIGGKAKTLANILSWENAIRDSHADIVVMPEALLGGYPKRGNFRHLYGFPPSRGARKVP